MFVIPEVEFDSNNSKVHFSIPELKACSNGRPLLFSIGDKKEIAKYIDEILNIF